MNGVIADLTGVGFLVAAGLTTMLQARQRAIACGTWFDLVCPHRLPRRVIELVGLDAVFVLHDSVAEAAAAQAGRPGSPTGAGPVLSA
ncbi:MAG: STAS domain-containing protein [Actinomycetota bacterium]|nr:STAS domain-containing protein [Actinomycetota bacterium]